MRHYAGSMETEVLSAVVTHALQSLPSLCASVHIPQLSVYLPYLSFQTWLSNISIELSTFKKLVLAL